MSRRSLGMSNLKSVALTILALLAFNVQKIQWVTSPQWYFIFEKKFHEIIVL